MLFPHTSALYDLPRSLSKEDILFVDGIRYASEMVHISYVRLCDSLIRLPDEDDQATHRYLMTCAVNDAWSVIDSADRLRGFVFRSALMNQIPGEKQKFLGGSEPIRTLRNTIQYIDAQIANHVGAEWPVWGFLRWFTWKDFPNTGTSCQLLMGEHVTKRPFKVEDPRQDFSGEIISNVLLSNKGVEVSLCDLRNSVKELAVEFESLIVNIAQKSESVPARFADVFISVNVDFRKS